MVEKNKQQENEELAQVAEDSKEKDSDLGKKEKGIIESIESLSVMELAALVKALEDKFGVSAAMPVMVAGVAPASAAAAAETETKSTFEIVLSEVGSNKIQVIKEVRAVSNLGLKEAKDLVESAPKTVLTGVKKEEAEEIKKKIEAAGAKVELK